MVEQEAVNFEVTGSSPVRGANQNNVQKNPFYQMDFLVRTPVHQPNPTHPSSAHLVSLSYPLSPSRKTFHSIRKPSSNQKSPHLRSARNLRLVGHNDASIIAKPFQKGNSFPTLQKDVSPISSSSPTPYSRSSRSPAPPTVPPRPAAHPPATKSPHSTPPAKSPPSPPRIPSQTPP